MVVVCMVGCRGSCVYGGMCVWWDVCMVRCSFLVRCGSFMVGCGSFMVGCCGSCVCMVRCCMYGGMCMW